ncbi:RNA helicase [Sesbania bispinosa]|nr:RNA helicase [Sesbania bispinosa]
MSHGILKDSNVSSSPKSNIASNGKWIRPQETRVYGREKHQFFWLGVSRCGGRGHKVTNQHSCEERREFCSFPSHPTRNVTLVWGERYWNWKKNKDAINEVKT